MTKLLVYLFVYGTLQPDYANSFAQLLHQNSRYIGPGTLPGRLYNMGPYPGVVHDATTLEKVQGSIFDIG